MAACAAHSAAQAVVSAGGAVRRATSGLLRNLGYTVSAVPNGQAAIHLMQTESMHLLLPDLNMPRVSGAELAGALESGQVVPHYQPKACLRTRHGWPIHEVEALTAWRIGNTETLIADEFLPLAEDGGLMPALAQSLIDIVSIRNAPCNTLAGSDATRRRAITSAGGLNRVCMNGMYPQQSPEVDCG